MFLVLVTPFLRLVLTADVGGGGINMAAGQGRVRHSVMHGHGEINPRGISNSLELLMLPELCSLDVRGSAQAERSSEQRSGALVTVGLFRVLELL